MLDTLGEYSIIMMDLNGLKSANDNIGHEAGDELISLCMLIRTNIIEELAKIEDESNC